MGSARDGRDPGLHGPFVRAHSSHDLIHLADLARFPQPPPFKKATSFTWALAHGTTISGAQHILAEGVIRPANWTYRTNLAKCELPTFGAYYLGRMIPNDFQYPDWTKKELLDSANLTGKGQQRIVMGAIFRGACAHTKFKAGGNEWAQVQVAKVGVVTTSEKYTIAHDCSQRACGSSLHRSSMETTF